MMGEIVARIIARTQCPNMESPQDPLRRKIAMFELIVCAFPNRPGRRFIQKLIEPEVPLQFKMRPVVKRIA
jgi:hypothetical protein